ncbi:ribose 5-phosphate isomerase B [Propionibacteriaceae bacterium ES.041]|uniref:ribose-5-phosphate isomerase n=1 Tax=Enemella evansiae TaxID=2016499 RepID=UPI000B965DF8|nr:ribose-5-phosphate isomerase [Enemella evansiae]OYN93707.1 ribose-5-phosphate isomerase [Enemella evansiae]PFG66734.1 ribose 5-phosphate isomerase B [Propionibacteriaceae bacterium ES.041]
MRVHLATDHAGLELKNLLADRLHEAGHQVIDHGAHTLDPEDDYPRWIIPGAEAVAADPGSLGIVIGGSGNGEQMAANKVRGIRAALAYDTTTASLARQHNDANVLSLGARMQDPEQHWEIVQTFLGTPFSQGERHIRRIGEVTAYEQEHWQG